MGLMPLFIDCSCLYGDAVHTVKRRIYSLIKSWIVCKPLFLSLLSAGEHCAMFEIIRERTRRSTNSRSWQ